VFVLATTATSHPPRRRLPSGAGHTGLRSPEAFPHRRDGWSRAGVWPLPELHADLDEDNFYAVLGRVVAAYQANRRQYERRYQRVE
jgi:hypothetical protein